MYVAQYKANGSHRSSEEQFLEINKHVEQSSVIFTPTIPFMKQNVKVTVTYN